MRLVLPSLLLSLSAAPARAANLVAPPATPLVRTADSAATAATAGVVERQLDPRLVLPVQRADAAAPERRAAAAVSLPNPNARQSVGLMIAGGAAVVVGAVVGGNAGGVLAVGGVVAGFYGLYHYITRTDGGAAAPGR